MRRRLVTIITALLATWLLPAGALACSRDDASYFDAFPDASCLLSLDQVAVDTLGGLRLVTDGDPITPAATWDTDTEFAAALDSSLAIAGGPGAPATLELPATTLPLTRTAAGDGSVLGPRAAALPDNDNVSDPSVVRTASGYVMYYTGSAEDGSGPAVFRATSADGRAWVRGGTAGAPQAVLSSGATGDFDEHGVFGADVSYDASDAVSPYRMWYSGRGPVFTQIGYATSSDGITWVKHAGPVVTVGQPGTRDSFRAAQPQVIRDGGLWKMWYEGDDSTKKSIDYATSLDGVTWSKAGAVITAESGGGNTEFGVFAPTVFKSGSTFSMLLAGRKQVSSTFQTKLIAASSSDGISWTLGNIALNSGSGFDASNLDAPDILEDPGDSSAKFKLYYAGNSVDANGDPHTRIGLSQTSAGSGWQGGKYDPPADSCGGCVLDVSATGTAFDARSAAGLSVAAAGGTPADLTGAYAGTRTDGLPRLGLKTSADGGAGWQPLTTAGQQADGSIVALGAANQFDQKGHDDPALLYDQHAGPGADWYLAFTAVNSSGVRSIGMTTTGETPSTLQPAGPWSATSQVLAGSGSGFDASGVSHPSVIVDGASYVMYYTGTASGGTMAIGRVTASAPAGPYTGSRAQITLNGTALCDPDGRRDPVVAKLATGDYRMLYTGLAASSGVTLRRACYATSSDGITWTRAGLVLSPSRIPFAHDEVAVTPSALLARSADLVVFTTGIDRFGRARSGRATTPLPTPATAAPAVPSGWATFQLGDTATPARDFRSVEQVASGSDAELWMSVLQPYSSAGSEYWSDFFPVLDGTGTENLGFRLDVRALRFQVRLRRGGTAPAVDRIVIERAPVRFAPAGTATTGTIAPPDGFQLSSWSNLVIESGLQSYGSGSGSAAVTVQDADSGADLVAKTTLTSATQTIALGGIDAAAHPKLRVRVDLASSHEQVTPRVGSLKLTYSAVAPGATPTPTPTPAPLPPPPVLTLAAAKPKVVYGRGAVLGGTLTQAGAAVGGQPVTVLAQPRGAATPAMLGTATTAADGTWSLDAKPRTHTTYSAAATGAPAPAAVLVQVKHKLTLRVRLRGRRAKFSGRIGPRHKRRAVSLQRRAGSSWRTVAKVRTSRRGTFRAAKAFAAKRRYKFRAVTGADASHLAGRSPVRKVRIR